LLDPGGVFGRNRDGVNVVLVREQDWPAGGAGEFVAAVRAYRGLAPLIVVVCPGRDEESAELRSVCGPGGLHYDEIAALYPLAEELDLGLDCVIFVDDNAKEVDEARAGAPEVLGLVLPANADEIPEFLRHVWAFDRARVTEEDRQRPELYAQRAERNRAERSAGSLEEFLASLNLEVKIAPMEAGQVERVAQLTQRTNQMNATC